MSARLALLALLLAMGAALLATAFAGRRAVSRASDTLVRGQAELFVETLRRAQRDARGSLSDEDLAQVLAEGQEEGLRFVALLRPGGRVIASAGTALEERAPEPMPGLRLERVGDRVRVAASPPRPVRPEDRPGDRFDRRRPPRPPGERPPPPPGRLDDRPPPPPDRLDDRPPPPPTGSDFGGPPPRRPRAERRLQRAADDEPARGGEPEVLLEFEPLLAAELERQANRSLGLGALVALALTAAALVAGRSLAQREAAERRLAEQRRLASLGEMSAVLAHEIRNPLASLKGHAQLLAEKLPADGPERRGAERVVGEARRLETLATRLLDFVRTARVEREPASPGALLRECAAEAGEGRVRVDDSRAPGAWSLDPLRVRQVLRNLLDNALEAAPEGAPVEARCAEERGRLVFEVRDHGPGLPEGDPERLFEPFHTTRTSGTGLGLAVARRVAELHGGRISAQDAPGGGALFRVELPKDGEGTA